MSVSILAHITEYVRVCL